MNNRKNCSIEEVKRLLGLEEYYPRMVIHPIPTRDYYYKVEGQPFTLYTYWQLRDKGVKDEKNNTQNTPKGGTLMEQTEQSIQRSGNLNPMWGKRHSAESKKKISDTQKARYAAISKAITEREDILDYGEDDTQTRRNVLRHLLDNNDLRFDNVKQAADFFVIMLGRDKIEEIIHREIHKYINENCTLREG